MITPQQKDEILLRDIESTEVGDERFALWWLGQSGFLVKTQQGRILFDPYLSNSLTRKYAETDKPHVRMTEIPLAAATLREISVATSTHNHTDHLDAETLLPLRAANEALELIIPEANRAFVATRLGSDPAWPKGFTDGTHATVGDFDVYGVPAAHEEDERDAEGRCKFMGYVVRFGRWSIYHSGDTVLYPGMVDRLKPLGIDVALLPINGRKAERRVSGNLWGREAAQLAYDIGAGCVVPCHYDMFTFNTENPEEFVRSCEALGQPHRVLQCGERFVYPASAG